MHVVLYVRMNRDCPDYNRREDDTIYVLCQDRVFVAG